jgi:hypothetical protein
MKRARTIVCLLALGGALPACGGGSAKPGSDGAAAGSTGTAGGGGAAGSGAGSGGNAGGAAGADAGVDRGGDVLGMRDGAGDTTRPGDAAGGDAPHDAATADGSSDGAGDAGASDRPITSDAGPSDALASDGAPPTDAHPSDAPPADAGPPCTTGSCPAQMYCNLLTHQCASGCENDNACITGETCLLPGHSCVCAAGMRVCANVCAADSPTRCGSGCQVCPGTANGDATCSGGTCGIACRAGYEACSSGCCRAFVVERVDPPVGGGGAHLPQFLFDGAGLAHVGYLDPINNAVIHAERSAGGIWTLEQFDDTPIYYETDGDVSIAVDAGGDVYMVYVTDTDIIHYARRTAGVWATEDLPQTPAVRGNAAIGVDPAGVVHIVYMTASGGFNLEHAWRAPGASAWSFEPIDTTPSVGNALSLAIDPATGHVHVAYFDAGNLDLKHASYDGTSWAVETVDRAGSVGQSSQIALDTAGNPRIAYHDETNLALKYAEWTGSAWTLSTVLTQLGKETALDVHLAIDATGAPWVTFYGDLNYRTEIYTRVGTTWGKVLIAASEPDGYDSAAARDPAGNVALLYTTSNENNLWMARLSVSTWVDEYVDPYEDAGDQSQMALDGSGRPHISYLNKITNDIWYATRAASGVWTRLRVAPAGATTLSAPIGGYTSVAVTPAGVPHVVWYNAATASLQHASYNPSTTIWAIDTVDAAPSGVPSPSMTLDASGQPHIAYISSTGLVVATRGAGGVYTTDAVTGGGTTHPFLILDGTGAPRLSLINSSGSAAYAYKQGTAWTVESIEAATASQTGLALDGNGLPHVCYAGPAGNGYNLLRHAVRGTAGGWSASGPTIANRDYGYFCSIAIDAQNQPHISYQLFSGGGAALEQAVLQAGAWVWTPIDTDLATGGSSSIGLDASGAAHISYYDNNRHQLRYAYQP